MDTVIERLDIRVRGISPDDGERLAARIGALLGDELATQTARHDLGTIVARVEASRDESVDGLARRVVDAVLRQL